MGTDLYKIEKKIYREYKKIINDDVNKKIKNLKVSNLQLYSTPAKIGLISIPIGGIAYFTKDPIFIIGIPVILINLVGSYSIVKDEINNNKNNIKKLRLKRKELLQKSEIVNKEHKKVKMYSLIK